ncbi:hypothetical protein Hanom_Chr06g00568331 [Helianthus anomalus]
MSVYLRSSSVSAHVLLIEEGDRRRRMLVEDNIDTVNILLLRLGWIARPFGGCRSIGFGVAVGFWFWGLFILTEQEEEEDAHIIYLPCGGGGGWILVVAIILYKKRK